MKRFLIFAHFLLIGLLLNGCAFTPNRHVTPTTVTPPPAPSNDLKPLVQVQAVETVVSPFVFNSPFDLWSRIRNNFDMKNVNDAPRVEQWEYWYASRPDYIERMVKRSERYLFYIVEEIEKRNMPGELILLPFIESAFNPQAVSSAKAAGMWQFMPATGRTFDLTQNIFRDERRDVIESTRAALTYLEKLYKMFGDWHLALAAYNWGEGNVMRAVKRAQAEGLEVNYETLRMPKETQNYVPKLQAIKNIISNPQHYKVALPSLPNHPFFDVVKIDKDIDVNLVAKLAQVNMDDFKALNPSLKHPVILAEGNPKILMPWENVSIFTSNLRSFKGALSSWTVWVAPVTLKVSEIAKQVRMPETEIRSINRIPQGHLVKAGSSLLVKRSKTSTENVSSQIAEHGQLMLEAELRLKKGKKKAKAGETVSSMAGRLGVPVKSLAEWNRLKPNDKLKKGQTLTVYLPEKSRKKPQKKKK